LSLVAGLFELNKPYFNIDTRNMDRDLGMQRAKGIELSVAGQLTRTLTVNAGAVLGEVQVIGPTLAAEGVGRNVLGQPHSQLLINLDYGLPKLAALSLDMGIYHFGSVPGTIDNAVYVPSVTVISLGDRYRFKLLGEPATLRVQVQNVTNSYIWNVTLSPGYLQFAPRAFVAYLTLDV
jgi:iron complex outermembrane receptor protein